MWILRVGKTQGSRLHIIDLREAKKNQWIQQEMGKRVPILTNSMSLQNYVNLKREAISAEYGQMPPFLHEEKQQHLERLQKEGQEISQQLKESQARMAHKRELLRGMYEELKEMCHKPDVELLLVGTEKSQGVRVYDIRVHWYSFS